MIHVLHAQLNTWTYHICLQSVDTGSYNDRPFEDKKPVCPDKSLQDHNDLQDESMELQTQ